MKSRKDFLRKVIGIDLEEVKKGYMNPEVLEKRIRQYRSCMIEGEPTSWIVSVEVELKRYEEKF